VYAHYYQVDYEKPGRGNVGGKIERHSVQLLRKAVSAEIPGADVRIISDTDEQFWSQRNATVQKYRTTLDDQGNYLYFPWKDSGYLYPHTLDNIVKQWHSINSVFNEMEATCWQHNIRYKRVAMLRLDVFYATPVDIYKLNHETLDSSNQYAVIPAFGKHPVNDRLIYGPYRAVKIWATERFTRIEDHVLTYERGYGMHSERFLNHSILPAIERITGTRVRENPDVCFMRVRPNGAVWTWDCNPSPRKRGASKRVKIDKKMLIESILERNCTERNSTGIKPLICNE